MPPAKLVGEKMVLKLLGQVRSIKAQEGWAISNSFSIDKTQFCKLFFLKTPLPKTQTQTISTNT